MHSFIHFVFVLFEHCFFVRIFLSQCNKFLFKFNQHQNKPKSQCNVCQQISVDRWLCWQIWMIRRNIAQFNITTYRLNYQQINKTKKGMYGIFICLFHIEKLIFQLWKWLVLLLQANIYIHIQNTLRICDNYLKRKQSVIFCLIKRKYLHEKEWSPHQKIYVNMSSISCWRLFSSIGKMQSFF